MMLSQHVIFPTQSNVSSDCKLYTMSPFDSLPLLIRYLHIFALSDFSALSGDWLRKFRSNRAILIVVKLSIQI